MPRGFDLERIADQPKVVGAAMAEFEHSFAEALAIVLAISFLSLGWRSGVVVALSVPLVLAMTFVAMHMLGIDLHRITLGALIIALGLLVDDAIIAVEMMVVKIEEGYSRSEAAAFAWRTTAFPMLTGTLVTIAGFVPIGFARSTVGEYAGGIFWVVAISLVASWIVAVAFTPVLGVWLLPRSASGSKHSAGGDPYKSRPYGILRRVVCLCVDRPRTTIGLTACVVAVSIAAFANVQQQFFPISERPELFLQLRLPQGSTTARTFASVVQAEALVAASGADVATYTAYIGAGSPRFWLGLNPELPNEAFAEIVIVARDVAAREATKARLESAVARGAIPDARVRVDRFNFGPPVGFPAQVRVVGPDPLKVREIAYETQRVMRENPTLIEPQLDWNETMPAARVIVDQGRARLLNLDVRQISQALQTLVSGFPVTTIREGTEQVVVVARAVGRERVDLGRLEDLSITGTGGVAVPLAQIARLEMSHEEPILWRRNRDMAITVRSDVVDGVQPPDAANRSWAALASLRGRLPSGYRLELGGAVEESLKANLSLAKLFPVMLLVTLTVLMIQLQSFSRLTLVLLTAPLGIVGASFGLNLAGKPFGFVALLGLIALAGMIMRNAVILVDQIEADVKVGRRGRREAIVEAVVRRARPVVLTAAAAVLAMIPLSHSAFWGPMAVTIMGGLVAATFLTLLFFPALYAFWFRHQIEAADDASQVSLAMADMATGIVPAE